MRIQTIQIQNYRCFEDSGELTFAAGFNLVIGRNNVGKSTLLECLSSRFAGDPHRSLHAQPTRDEPIPPHSSVYLTLIASGEETRRVLLTLTGKRFLPWPPKWPVEKGRGKAALNEYLTAREITYRAVLRAPPNVVAGWTYDVYPLTRLFPDANETMLELIVGEDRRTIHTGSVHNPGTGNDAGMQLVQLFGQRIYRFSAERLTLGTHPFGSREELASNASNLAEVLNTLQHNVERCREYRELVREVFPLVQSISVRPVRDGGNQVEILVWQFDPASQRDDLAIPLARCGTGIGQVLAILYVVKTSEQPRTIIIDEPGSFLHPGASRALMSILKRFPQHQYIIATHSTEVIAELSDSAVTLLRWDEGRTHVEQHPKASVDVLNRSLAEVGAKLSDVFGFDRILWVEGQSDAASFQALTEARYGRQRGLGILPVRDTGSFSRRNLRDILHVYRQLSMSEALLPTALAFIFDRDGRQENDMQDARRQSQNKIQFLDRRMLENYFIDPSAIAAVLSNAGKQHHLSFTSEQVEDWLRKHGIEKVYFPDVKPAPVFSSEWRRDVHGARLLENLTAELSDQRLQYQKVTHTPALARALAKASSAELDGLYRLIADVLTVDTMNAATC
jgi:hypothetical protein